jgi:glycosyltransferase involved in cell wall biosynthesis
MSCYEPCICTVLLITYNHEPYIRTAIESVLDQKTEYKYKIHIFDDASTDNSAAIASEYVDKYPDKVFLFSSKENKGAQENIWTAYNSVDTKYCCLLETDDYWCDNNKLDLQIKALEENIDCSFCSHCTLKINENDKYRQHEDGMIDIFNRKILESVKISIDDIKGETAGSGYIPTLSSRLIRFSVLNLKDIKYKESFLWDNCQFFYLLLKGKMYFINKVMSVYRMTGNGIYSGNDPIIRMEKFIDAHLQFNKETEYLLGDKIFREIAIHIKYYLYLMETLDVFTGNDVDSSDTATVEENILSKIFNLLKQLIKLFLPPVFLLFYKFCKRQLNIAK